MTTSTLSLGPLVLVATQDGPLLRVSVSTPTTVDAGALCLTIPEWSSLAALADVLAAGERRHAEDRKEIERLTTIAAMAEENERIRETIQRAVTEGRKSGAFHLRLSGCEWSGAFHLRLSGCEWCGLIWPKADGDTEERIHDRARQHAFVCAKHPLREDRDRLRAEIDVLRQECRELTAQRDAACSAHALRERMEGGQ